MHIFHIIIIFSSTMAQTGSIWGFAPWQFIANRDNLNMLGNINA